MKGLRGDLKTVTIRNGGFEEEGRRLRKEKFGLI